MKFYPSLDIVKLLLRHLRNFLVRMKDIATSIQHKLKHFLTSNKIYFDVFQSILIVLISLGFGWKQYRIQEEQYTLEKEKRYAKKRPKLSFKEHFSFPPDVQEIVGRVIQTPKDLEALPFKMLHGITIKNNSNETINIEVYPFALKREKETQLFWPLSGNSSNADVKPKEEATFSGNVNIPIRKQITDAGYEYLRIAFVTYTSVPSGEWYCEDMQLTPTARHLEKEKCYELIKSYTQYNDEQKIIAYDDPAFKEKFAKTSPIKIKFNLY